MIEQPWMRLGSHQVTTLILAHKDDNAILEPSALCVRSALVNKLYYTDVYCDRVSCLHHRTKDCHDWIQGLTMRVLDWLRTTMRSDRDMWSLWNKSLHLDLE